MCHNDKDCQVSIQEYQAVCRERDRLKAENQRFRTFFAWQGALFANPSLAPTDKLNLEATERRALQNPRLRNEDGSIYSYYPVQAETIGMSDDAVGKSYRKLEASGLIELDTVRDPDDPRHSKTYVKFSDALRRAPRKVELAKPRNTGNNQKKHFISPCCHKPMVKVKRVLEGICPGCGQVHYLDPMNPKHAAFIVDDETAGHWDEWYGDVQVEADEGTQPQLAVDTDSALQAVSPVPDPVTPLPEPVEPEPQHTRLMDYAPRLARPWACHCGIRLHWIERNGITHCSACEPLYRGVLA